jgi:predicted AAA+ superfamily ATPase
MDDMARIGPTGYYATREQLRRRLAERAPARVQLLTGPRQVGKTTLLLELAQEWGERAIYLAADTPEAALPGWWEAQWQRATRLAGDGTALLLIDEIHYLPD